MKKLILFLLPLLLIGCSSTPQEKAIKQVKKHLKQNSSWSEYRQYNEISWGDIEPYHSSLEDDKFYQSYKMSADSIYPFIIDMWTNFLEEAKKQKNREDIKTNKMVLKDYTRMKKETDKLVKLMETKYADGLDGWTIKHVYAFPNELNVLEQDTVVYFVSKDFKDVIPFYN